MLVCAEPVIRPASPELEALNGGSVDRIAWGGVVDAAFKARVTSISLELQVAVDFLMAAIAFESAGTFSASVPNAAGSGAVGLIQFMPATARGLGTTTAALAAMSATQQLDYVRLYFLPYSGRLHTLEDVYMAILYPAAIGKGASHVLFSSGTTAYAAECRIGHQQGRLSHGGRGCGQGAPAARPRPGGPASRLNLTRLAATCRVDGEFPPAVIAVVSAIMLWLARP